MFLSKHYVSIIYGLFGWEDKNDGGCDIYKWENKGGKKKENRENKKEEDNLFKLYYFVLYNNIFSINIHNTKFYNNVILYLQNECYKWMFKIHYGFTIYISMKN